MTNRISYYVVLLYWFMYGSTYAVPARYVVVIIISFSRNSPKAKTGGENNKNEPGLKTAAQVT